MRTSHLPLLPLALVLLTSSLHAQNVQHGLRVPDGFEVVEFADDKLANDIYRLTVDPRGRIVVSGRGYVRILVDENNDGRADRALPFADGPKDGAMGLLWEGDWLYFTGDGGLRRYRVAKDGDKADGPSELIRSIKTGNEHDAHDIRRGPDGWLYVLCGNNARIDKSYAQLRTSPIQEPIAGCVLRFSPDLKSSEIVADGFRNAYGMDFNLDGELFTYDSDNERCVNLPWYEETRFYHVIPGGHYGWQSPQRAQTWRMPPYFPDVIAPVAYLERGSPTGVACYRHTQFPEAYRGGMFALDWTFGRVWFLPLNRSGASYTCKPEVFLQSVGDNGFAPTDGVVHPRTGDLYISLGGRGTRGAVYRVRYPKRLKEAENAKGMLPVPARSLDWRPELLKELPDRAAGQDGLDRLRALLAIRRHHVQFKDDQLRDIIQTNWHHPDRSVRKAAADLISHLSPLNQHLLVAATRKLQHHMTCCLGYSGEPGLSVVRACGALSTPGAEPSIRMEAVRALQRALGDLMAPDQKGTVWEGYSPGRVCRDKDLIKEATSTLLAVFPSKHRELDREIARTLALVEDDRSETLKKVADCLTEESHPTDDIHYLIVLARLRGPRPAAVTRQVAGTLLALDHKFRVRRLNRDTNWPLRLAEVHAELARKDPKLNAALLTHPEFGRPDHALFARCPGFDQVAAAEVFLARAGKEKDFAWSAELIGLVSKVPDEQCVPVLRRLWEQGGLEEAILPVLARRPQDEDRNKFLEGLNSPQLATIRLCIEALDKLPARNDGPSVLPLIRALRRLSDSKEEAPLTKALGRQLERVTGQQLGRDRQKWSDWFAKAHPDLAAKLGGTDGVDVAGWNKRLTQLDWSAGEVERGRAVFAKASCATCHSGAQALGPDLQGVAGRFSRDDLFTAILQPSKDISPRYRTTLIATPEGKVYQGSVIYEAVDGLIVQTGPATTVRITSQQLAARRFTDTSLMPPGLLDKLADRDIADLYAYLRSLSASSTSPQR